MKILSNIEPRYTGKYLVRVGQFYWIPSIRNPYNAYEEIKVKGVNNFMIFVVEVTDETEEDIFLGLDLLNDQVIISMEIL